MTGRGVRSKRMFHLLFQPFDRFKIAIASLHRIDPGSITYKISQHLISKGKRVKFRDKIH